MQKARSRLKKSPAVRSESNSPEFLSRKAVKPPKIRRSPAVPSPTIQRYLRHLPILFFSLIFYGTLIFLTKNYYPDAIRHFILPNTYLPFQLLLFLANWSLFSFIFLHTRRGFLISLILQMLIFLKLQQISVTPVLVLSIVGGITILEVLLSLSKRLVHSK